MPARLILTPETWARHGLAYARGQAFDSEGKLLRAAELAALFEPLSDRDGWLTAAAALNGSFAVVRVDDSQIHAAVDRLRGFPLFFAHIDGGMVVADTAHAIAALLPRPTLDPVCAREFRLTGYVTGSRTLIDGLCQIPAGHCLWHRFADALPPSLQRYYEFQHRSFFTEGDATLTRDLVDVHERVFRRLLRDVGDRPIVVPLSGGYDSRLIGVMLRDLGCRDVLCYSYGTHGNWESRISHELATYLGFRWTMVAYTAASWSTWAATPEFQHYFRHAGNLTAVSHIQDWPAVYELKRRGELPSGAVFVPGHSGDFLAGSHVPKWYPSRTQLSRADILRSLFDVHFSLWDWPADDAVALRGELAERIEQVTGPIAESTPEKAADTFEYWDLQERQAKFIVNSVRVYESFDYEWRLPLFDAELMDFWARVPLRGRVGRRLYFEFVRAHQKLPITPANADHSAPVSSAIELINRLGLRPLAKRAQRALRRMRWKHQYEHSDLAWFALVDRDQFRALYTGREIGHSFFALKYLETVASSPGGALRTATI
jgi:asparagine synthase (glutamine-hydrolysing)